MNILITGGAGYLGSALVNYLLPNHNLIVIDNFYKGRPENLFPNIQKYTDNLSLYKLDIRNKEKIKTLLEETNPETIIHCAAIVDAFTTNSPDKKILCEEVIYEGTVNLWNIARKIKPIKQFINTSTVSLYSQGTNIKEDDEKNPLSTYGITKLKAEQEIMIPQNDILTTSLRPATITGYSPGLRYETVINFFTMCAATNQVLPVFKKALDEEKTFLDITDACRAYQFCLENPEKVAGQSYNVVSYNTTMRKVLDILKKHFPSLKTKIIDSGNVSQQVYTVSGEKFNNLGFKPKPNLDKQIESIKKHFEKQSVINEELFKLLN